MSEELMDIFLLKMSENSGNLNQILAFMSLSNTMTALNLISSSEQKTSSGGSIDALLKGSDAQGLQSVIGNMLGQGGNKLNLSDLVGTLGSTIGQQGQGQGKLNPQMLLSLLSMFSQMETKKKPTPIEEKEEEAEEEKVKENSKEKQHQDKK